MKKMDMHDDDDDDDDDDAIYTSFMIHFYV